MKADLPIRPLDQWGEGFFGAPRGDRTHNGIDYVCREGTVICAPISGMVTKHGFPYAEGVGAAGQVAPYRYVEIEDELEEGQFHRVFYVEPVAAKGFYVSEGQEIGIVQNLELRYEGITNHVHYEVIRYEDGKKVYLDPDEI